MAHVRLDWHSALSPEEAAGITTLVTEVARVDGGQPASEDIRLQLRAGAALQGSVVTAHILAPSGAEAFAGFAHLGPPAPTRQAELLVHPRHRRRGVGSHLVEALLAVDTRTGESTHAAEPDHGGQDSGDTESQAGSQPENQPVTQPVHQPVHQLAVWAHGDGAAAAALARRYGFTRRRVLLLLALGFDDTSVLPEVALPAGVRVRPFDVGRDEQAWLELNRLVFAGHPEQGRWTEADLRSRQAEPWFDPAGFLLAEVGDRLVGFHWTKVHPGTTPAGGLALPGRDAPGPVGEVYVIGVAPAWSGSGLGRGLLAAGLRHLRERGVPTVMLYVDESNTRAVRLYTGTGFDVFSRDVCYVRRVSSIPGQ